MSVPVLLTELKPKFCLIDTNINLRRYIFTDRVHSMPIHFIECGVSYRIDINYIQHSNELENTAVSEMTSYC